MPRPKTIAWETRVAVFLTYRRIGGKVNPVANRYGIARSTVNVIVKEFVDMGFANRPRATLSPEYLKEMQEQHIQRVLYPSGEPQATDGGPGHLVAAALAQLNVNPADGEEQAPKLADDDPSFVPEELKWHLKDTAAERVIQDARNAARDFHLRDREAWRDLRLALEAACGLKEERAIPVPPSREPYLHPALKNCLRNSFFDRAFQSQAPTPDWLEWHAPPNDPRVLQMKSEVAAVGGPEDHQRVKNGVVVFLTNSYRELQRRFVEVERLRRDLVLFQQVLSKTVSPVSEEEIRRRICPACPYPEAQQEPDTDTGIRKRRTRAEIPRRGPSEPFK
jgi:DNA-binding Lrp family transcriptional regulator